MQRPAKSYLMGRHGDILRQRKGGGKKYDEKQFYCQTLHQAETLPVALEPSKEGGTQHCMAYMPYMDGARGV